MMKNVQQMRTMFPIGRSDDNRVCTTSFKPGARLITLQQQQQQVCLYHRHHYHHYRRRCRRRVYIIILQ